MEFTEKLPRYGKPELAGDDFWVGMDSAERMKPDLGEEGVGERRTVGFWRWVEIGFLCNWGLWVVLRVGLRNEVGYMLSSFICDVS